MTIATRPLTINWLKPVEKLRNTKNVSGSYTQRLTLKKLTNQVHQSTVGNRVGRL